jgi:hypothetical protein
VFEIVPIRTPTELARTTGSHDATTHWLVSPSPEIESEVRRALDEIFADLPYVGGEPELMRAYLDGVEQPLRRLRELGFQLLGVVVSGTMAIRDHEGEECRMPWRRTHYIVASNPSYYRLLDEAPPRVHKLGVDCVGIRQLIAAKQRKETPFVSYASLEDVERDFEGSVLWCEACEWSARAERALATGGSP